MLEMVIVVNRWLTVTLLSSNFTLNAEVTIFFSRSALWVHGCKIVV